jgi:IclR family transcriptional regulator, mhp operon transcriptional activator
MKTGIGRTGGSAQHQDFAEVPALQSNLRHQAAAILLRTLTLRPGNVCSLGRGLALLELVNDEGGVRSSDAAHRLHLPRPTAHRLLKTLESLGYLEHSRSDNRYCVTIKARRLSGGYGTDAQLSEIAGPSLSQLLRDPIWPVNIVTRRGAMLVVRETTQTRSPLLKVHNMVGLEVPMLRTACGRAYLAFCSEQERRDILDCLCTKADPDDEPYLNADALEEMLARCRKNGYGTRFNEAFIRKTSSVAVPIMINGYARACIAVVWLTAEVPAARAIKQFLPRLAEVAEMLGRRLTFAQWSLPEVNLQNLPRVQRRDSTRAALDGRSAAAEQSAGTEHNQF